MKTPTEAAHMHRATPALRSSALSLTEVSFSYAGRWQSAGGEAGVAMETQHEHRVPGGRCLAAGPRPAQHPGGGDHGGELRDPARHQLHPEEAHHQPLPHVRHTALLEHSAEVTRLNQSVGP